MPDYSKLAKGLTSFVKGATKPVRTFRTPDGYTFHELPNGKIVDNLDPAKVDMSWPNAKVFQKETGAFQLGDELGSRKAMIESTGKPNLMKDLPSFMNKPTPEDLFQQALNKQNASKPVKGGLNEVKKPQEILPAAEREANKQKFMDESAESRRMYHSTANEFKEFLPSGSSRAVFVTPEAEFANTFALDNFTKGGGNQEFMTGTRSMPVRVQVKNPFDYENPEHIDNLKKLARERFPGNQQVMDEIDAMGMFEHNWPSVENPDIQRLIKQAGHDAFYASERGTKNLGIYDPKSIKSDIGNKGTYDMTKGDINEAKGGAIRMQVGGLSALAKLGTAGTLTNKLSKGQDAARRAELLMHSGDNTLPLILPRARLSSDFIDQQADRVARQMLGEHVTTGKDTTNLAGRSVKESQRVKGLNYKTTPTGTVAQETPYTPRKGDVKVAFPGDQTVSNKVLNEVEGFPIDSAQEGGAYYGLGQKHLSDPEFWKSTETPAKAVQGKVDRVAELYEPDRVIGTHLAMGPMSNNFAMHFADANLRAIDWSKAQPKNINVFDSIIAYGYKDPKTGEKVKFPNWPGLADREGALAAMKEDSNLRKWVNNRFKTPSLTKPLGLPNGLDIQYAITEPRIRDMEINMTGLMTGKLKPGAKVEAAGNPHNTYSHRILGEAEGPQEVLTPFVIDFPDAAQHIASTKRPSDFTGTIQKVFPHQIVDDQYLNEYNQYRERIKKLTGQKDGGSIEAKPFHDFDQIMKRKDGGTVNQSFEQQLMSALANYQPNPNMLVAPSMRRGGEVHMSKGGVLGAIAEGVGAVTKTLPKVDRLSMSYKDVTKRVPEVSEAVEKLFRGEITKEQYNDIVNLYKPVTPYSFVPKPATAEEAINALRGDAAKSRYGKQEEYPPGTKVGLRLDIPAYTQKGVWVNSIHDQKGKKVAYGPVSSVKNADLGISQNQSKKIAQGGEKQSYARIVGDWNPMTEEEAVAKAQKYLNDPEWKQIGIDPERHSYFYDRATMAPITGADEVIQIGPLVLGKNPKYGKIDDFEYAKGGYAYIPPFAKGGLSRQYSEAGSVLPPTPQEIEQMAGAQKAAFGVFPQMASQSWQQQSPFADKASEMLKAQVTKEWEQAGRPGGAKELSLRISAVLAGQVPDFVNFGQSMIPGLNKPASVLDPEGEKVARFPMSGTSTDIKNSMREKGMINEDEYPLAELAGVFGAPYAAVKAPKAIKGGLNMVKPVIKEAGDMASRAVVPMRRQFEPSTFTVESTADDLGQNTTYGFRQGVNDVLLGNPNLGTGKNKSREAVGTFMNPNKLINPKGLTEINPMMAIDVRGAGTIGNVPSANKALRKQVGQLGEDLNQTSMAGHRFIPLMTNNIKDASSMLIKTPQGLNKDEIKQLAVLLGDDMVLAHNPRLGGVVVMPFGRVEKGQIPEEFLKAQSAANEVLGKRGKVQFGVSDFDKDRLFMEKTKGDYVQAGANQMSKEQQAQREKLQGLEKFLFPQSRSGIPGQVKAAPVGGLQPWSVGSDYPTSVIGIGNGSRVQYQPRNFSTGKEGSRYDTYMDAEQERAQMLDEFHRTLVPKYR